MNDSEIWTYDKDTRVDKKGHRWHFVRRETIDDRLPYEDQPYEIYFRDDTKEEFGVLKFQKRKDNPYRDYLTMINKTMNDAEFRKTILEPETRSVWRRNWK